MKSSKLLLLSSLLFTIPSFASDNTHTLIAPKCLVDKLNSGYSIVATKDQMHLIQVNNKGLNHLMQFKTSPTALCGGFMDVSADWKKAALKGEASSTFLANALTIPSANFVKVKYAPMRFQQQVQYLFSILNPQSMLVKLTELSNFPDRYANSKNGVQAADWFKQQIESLSIENKRSDVEITYIKTGSYKQPSVVVKVGDSNEPAVVVSAHMDTLSSNFSKKPGADDDGSGSVTVLETARLIISSGLKFKNPIYFIWYAAEEEGLVGSGHVVTHFKEHNIPVAGVLHFDMTGYTYVDDPSIWLITDYVNKDLSNYLETVINTYIKQPIKYTKCGYACSDHARWTQKGYPAIIPAETAFEHTNPNIHSSTDTMDKLILNHMIDYAKLAIAFTIEMAEPI